MDNLQPEAPVSAGIPELGPGQRRFLVVYHFTSYSGPGEGNTFVTVEAGSPVTADSIRTWESIIKRNNGFTSVVIRNFQPLEG